MQMETISIEQLFLYFFHVSNVPTVTALPPGGADLTCENVVLLHDVRGVFFFFFNFFFYTQFFFFVWRIDKPEVIIEKKAILGSARHLKHYMIRSFSLFSPVCPALLEFTCYFSPDGGRLACVLTAVKGGSN